jgi:hypothetical protein
MRIKTVVVAFLLTISFALLNVTYANCQSANGVTGYSGGSSTPLQAIIGIATTDKVPMGIILGVKQTLCEPQRKFSFSGMSTLQALQKALEGTGYTVMLEQRVYEVKAPDLTRREQEVLTFQFPKFGSTPTSMSGLGAWLTGYVLSVIEGGGGFAVDTLGSTNDEIIQIPEMRDLSAPQIANEIVKLGSKGIWVMRATRCDSGPKPGSTLFDFYSYHDALQILGKLTCPQTLVCN